MSEIQPDSDSQSHVTAGDDQAAPDEKVPDLTGEQFAQLVDLVYGLMKKEFALARERRGVAGSLENRR